MNFFEERAKKAVVWLFFILSVLSFASAWYLFQEYGAGGAARDHKDAFCNITDAFNCTAVNTSPYAYAFGVPFSFLGIFYFAGLLFLVLRAMRRKVERKFFDIFAYSVAGVLFVLYFWYAEIVIGAFCVLCIVVHGAIIVTAVLSYVYARKEEDVAFSSLARSYGAKTLAVVGIVAVIASGLFLVRQEKYKESKRFVECLQERGVVMYGSYVCPACISNKRVFGPAEKDLPYIECHPNGPNTQTELCREKGIRATPTWIIERDGEEIERAVGFMGKEELAAFSGCSL